MANIVNSANMSLPIPVVGVDPGPDYATNVNNSLTIIDGHNHSPGSGVQITPAGLNINVDLPVNANNITLARSLRFTPQSSPIGLSSDLGCLYESGVDLYYNDGLGNQIRFTQSGSIVGTAGSISGLVSPASATYVAGDATFVWQSNANTPANMDAASYTFRNLVANSKGLTLSPPNSMGSDYTLVLPALPVTQSIMTLDAAGNITAPWTVDGTTLYVSSNVLQIKPKGVSQGLLADRATGTTVAAGGVGISSPVSSFTSGSTTPVDVPNLTITITTTGRPVSICVQGDPSAVAGPAANVQNSTNANTSFYIVRGSTVISKLGFNSSVASLAGPPTVIQGLDIITAGTYAYKIQVSSGSGTTTFQNCILVVYEI